MSSDERVEEELLARLHEDPRSLLTAHNVFEDVVEALGEVTEDDIEYVATRFDDRGHIDYAGGLNSTISLTPRGLQRYEELSGETVIGDYERPLLQFLYEHEQENLRSPSVDRDGVIAELDLTAEDIDTLVWYLEAVGVVDTTSGMGSEFHAVEITETGRQRVE
jgi:hypothetical protein